MTKQVSCSKCFSLSCPLQELKTIFDPRQVEVFLLALFTLQKLQNILSYRLPVFTEYSHV